MVPLNLLYFYSIGSIYHGYFHYLRCINIIVHTYNLISEKHKIKAKKAHLPWPEKRKALVNKAQIYVYLNADSCYLG